MKNLVISKIVHTFAPEFIDKVDDSRNAPRARWPYTGVCRLC